MILVRVNATIGKQAEEMQPATAAASVLHGGEQGLVAEEVAFLDHEIDLGDVHVNDAPGTDVQMADFTVTHLPLGETYVASAGVNEGVGEIAQHGIVKGFARERDGIGLGGGSVAPTIENHEDKWFIHHAPRIVNGLTTPTRGERKGHPFANAQR